MFTETLIIGVEGVGVGTTVGVGLAVGEGVGVSVGGKAAEVAGGAFWVSAAIAVPAAAVNTAGGKAVGFPWFCAAITV